MKLLILGASGNLGRLVVEQALERGHDVTAVVRSGTAYTAPAGVRMERGEPLDEPFLDRLVRGQDAVISCLGLRRAGKSPWSRLLSPPDLTARVTRHMTESMLRHGVSRLLAVSAAGVGDSYASAGAPIRFAIRRGSLGAAYRDLENMEAVLRGSGLDWLAVRPVTLSDGARTGRAAPVARYTITSSIRRADVAQWMLAQVEAPPPFKERTVLLG